MAHTRKSMHVFLGRIKNFPLPFQGYCPGTWVPRPVSHFLSLSTLSSRGDQPRNPGPQLLTHLPLALPSGQGPPTQTQLLLIPASYRGHPIVSLLAPPPLARWVLTLQRRQQSPSLHMASCVRVHFLQQLPPARLHS